MCIISAFAFAFGFKTFSSIDPTLSTSESFIAAFATGGMSGVSQCIILICQKFGVSPDIITVLPSVLYFLLNVPLLIFSFVKLGWKFSLYTFLNVGFVSIFLNSIDIIDPNFFRNISEFIKDETLARAIFAGICTGIASAVAFKSNHSTGGIDIIAYYISLKKSTNTGKYIGILNGCIVFTFSLITLLTVADVKVGQVIITACFSVVYLFSSSLVVDFINVKNKKVMLQIITSNAGLSRIIIANVPHSCTLIDARGGYSGSKKIMIHAVVSNNEVSKLVKEIRHVDESSFINTIDLKQVYGHFFIKHEK